MSGLGAILVTGGAGYIGSHVVLELLAAGFRPVVVDDLSTGQRRLVPPEVPLIQGDCGDSGLMRDVLLRYRCAAVIHMAGAIIVAESVEQPLKYYWRNTATSVNLLTACLDAGVRGVVFSSTAAVYGIPDSYLVNEEMPLRPISPYGHSKMMTEQVMSDVTHASGIGHVILRYFNVAGADAQGRAGQISPNATHLLKVAMQATTGQRDGVDIFGGDYDTPDGTCIRDYIHVSDLAAAHVAAVRYLLDGGSSTVMNCGYGRGVSVREMLAAVERVTGIRLNQRVAPRRTGDPPRLVADIRRITATLDWQPANDSLDRIIDSALAWERRLKELV